MSIRVLIRYLLFVCIILFGVSCNVADKNDVKDNQLEELTSDLSFDYSYSDLDLLEDITEVEIYPRLVDSDSYAYAIDPSLPSGLTLNTDTGYISGIATEELADTAFIVTAWDGDYTFKTTITIAVTKQAPLVITYPDTPLTWDINVSGSKIPTITGGDDNTFTVTPALPSGLTLDPTTGVVSGTPTEATNQNYAFTVTNSAGSITQDLSVYVQNEVPAFNAALFADTFTQSVANTLTSHPLDNSGTIDTNDVTYEIDPSLPTGLTLDTNTGDISGTLSTSSIVGVYTYSYTAKSNAGQDTITLTLTLDPNIKDLTYTLSSTIIEGQTINLMPSYEGVLTDASTAVYSVNAGALPTGLSIDASTGRISGTISDGIVQPSVDDLTSQAYSFTIDLDDTAGGGTTITSQTISGIVVEQDLFNIGYFDEYTFYTDNGAENKDPNPQAYSSPENQNSTNGATCTSGISAFYAEVSGVELNVAGYPLGFDCQTGQIQYTGVDDGNNYDLTVSITGTNSGENTTGSSLTKSVNIKIIDANIASAGYSSTLNFNYGDATSNYTPTGMGAIIRTWSVSPSLPSGLTLNTSTGVISGTPGAYVTNEAYTITASNHVDTVTFTFYLTISGIAPNALTMADIAGTQCTAIASTTPTVGATSTTPIAYSVSPVLPSGLSLNSTSGEISGTPLHNLDTTTYTMTATNAHGTDTDTFDLYLAASIAPTFSVSDFNITLDEIITNQLPDTGTANSACAATNSTIYVYATNAGGDAWPTDISVDADSGEISGTVALADITNLVNDIDPTQNTETYQMDGSYDDGGNTSNISFTVTYYPQLPSLVYVDDQMSGTYDDNDNTFNLYQTIGTPQNITVTSNSGDVAVEDTNAACGFFSVKGDNITTELTDSGCGAGTETLTGLPAGFSITFNYLTGEFILTDDGGGDGWCNVNTGLDYQVRGQNASGYSPYTSVSFNIYDRIPTDFGYVATDTPTITDSGDKLWVFDFETDAGATPISNSALTVCSSTNLSYTSNPTLSDGGVNLDVNDGEISYSNTGLVARQDYLITVQSTLPSDLAESQSESIKVMNPYFGDDLDGMRTIIADVSGDDKEDIILISSLCDLSTADGAGGCATGDSINIMVQASDGSFNLSGYGGAIPESRMGQASLVEFLNTTSGERETGLVYMDDATFPTGAFTIEVQSFITSTLNSTDGNATNTTATGDDIFLATLDDNDFDSSNNNTTLAAFHNDGGVMYLYHYTIGDDAAITYNNTATITDTTLLAATNIYDMAIFHADTYSSDSNHDLVILYESGGNGYICIIKGSTLDFNTSCSTNLTLPTATDDPVQVIPANVANIGVSGLTDLVILDENGVMYAYNNDDANFVTSVNPSWTYSPSNYDAANSPIDLSDGREFAVKDVDNDSYPDVVYSFKTTGPTHELYTYYNLYNASNPTKTLILPSVPHKSSDVLDYIDDENADSFNTSHLGLVEIKDDNGDYVDTAAIHCELSTTATTTDDSFCSIPALIDDLDY
ncbi:Ig domain-containing protein [Bacteriovoracaceae bacterium]|nr:Ig domain-containing protein [Bacteriovoracaceae bacterium]